MPTELYRRGEFWLAAVSDVSTQNLYVHWYDRDAGRVRRRSTRTSDLEAAKSRLDQHYLATRPNEPVAPAALSLEGLIGDYYLEHGSKVTSADAVSARLNHVLDFIECEKKASRLPRVPSVKDVTANFVTRFREWSLDQPCVARNKDGVITKSWKRAPATTEKSLGQLRAVLGWAYRSNLIESVPFIQLKKRRQISSPVRRRLTVEQIANFLTYTIRGNGKDPGHVTRLTPLRRALIAAICTIARPEAIVDIHRDNWDRDGKRIDLNPPGREQTHKYRPVIPVVPLLAEWLNETDDWFIWKNVRSNGVMKREPVSSVHNAFNTMLAALGMEPHWELKDIRRSMGTMLRNRYRVDMDELSGWMGHSLLQETTEIYAIYDPDYMGTVCAGIEAVIEDLKKLPMVAQALDPIYGVKQPAVLNMVPMVRRKIA